MLCIAMGYKKRPLRRFVVSVQRDLAYLKAAEQQTGDDHMEGAIGFPAADVFDDDDGLFHDLVKAFESGDAEQLDRLWRLAKPLPGVPH